MRFDPPLTLGTLLRRYKRFLADVRLDDGEELTAHVANTGSMRGCAEPGSRVALSHHPNKGRKLPWSWELVRIGDAWVAINTAHPNHVVEETVRAGRIRELSGYGAVRREAPFAPGTRFDLLLEEPGRRRCWVEVKNVTLREDDWARFPDAVTARGAKHLRRLHDAVVAGDRAVCLFLVNRPDCARFGPARSIDPGYADALALAARSGVELLAYRASVTLEAIRIDRRLPLSLECHATPPRRRSSRP